jgi:hypothetical protein
MNDKWDLFILETYANGDLLVGDPTGQTSFMTRAEYEIYTNNRN